MPIFDPDTLAKWTSGDWKSSPKGSMTGFGIDSRKLKTGDIFVAINADRDGHDYLSDAEQNGAVAGLVNKARLDIKLPQLLVKDSFKAFHDIASSHRQKFNGTVVGITGSCGKTSTKDALAILLGENETLYTEGNFNNHLGVPLTLLRIDYENHRKCVVEAGINRIGEMKILSRMISPDIVIVTLIAPSHLEGLINLDTIASEKADLFLKSDRNSTVIFPEDCLKYKEFSSFCKESENVIVLREGQPKDDVKPKESHYSIWTETNKIGSPSLLRLWRHGLPSVSISVPILSRGMGRNIALAVLAACEAGVSVQEISDRLPRFRPSALRGKFFQGRGRSYLLDCYNANPASMEDSIEFFKSKFPSTPKLYVLAGMEELGGNEKIFHVELGKKITGEKNDVFILLGKKASWIAEGLLENGIREDQIIVLMEMSDAIPIVEDFNGSVLFKGSRTYELENLLPSWAVEENNAGEESKC
jgi:UDP-N-acetylmuramoyl-tripeptide--D-alanyl-D-alanine ligase